MHRRLEELEARAVERIRLLAPKTGLFVGDSGGKDSEVVRRLVKLAGVPAEFHYSFTTVDPPEVVEHIRHHHPETKITIPEWNMWRLIPHKKMPPTRMVRYCCEFLKEQAGGGRTVCTGIRWQESSNRSKRAMVEACKYGQGRTFLHPIIDWTVADVWGYLKATGTKYCGLYDEGFKRLGCVGCPMQGPVGMRRDLERWPKYAAAYLRAFHKMLEARRRDGMETKWKDADDVMAWWLQPGGRRRHKAHRNQLELELLEEAISAGIDPKALLYHD